MSVYKKLMQARIALQSTTLTKSGLNKFAGYKYFELGDFLPAIQSIFKDVGLCGIISYGREIATLTIIDTDGDGRVEITSPMSTAALKGCHEVQNLGAVQTYIRRYLWVTAMEIVEHDALDSAPPQRDSKGIPASFKSSPLQGATDAINEEDLQFLRDMAIELMGMVRDGEPDKAWSATEKANLDDEQKMALWTMLDSKTRSAIKAAKPQLTTTQKETA